MSRCLRRLLLVLAALAPAPAADAGYGCPTLFGAFPQVATLAVESGQVRFTRAREVAAAPPACSENVFGLALTMNEFLELRPEYKPGGSKGYTPDEIEQKPTGCTRTASGIYFGVGRHFVPRDETSRELRETTCRELYQQVASRLPEVLPAQEACELEGSTARDMFRVLLKEHRPRDAEAVDWSGR